MDKISCNFEARITGVTWRTYFWFFVCVIKSLTCLDTVHCTYYSARIPAQPLCNWVRQR